MDILNSRNLIKRQEELQAERDALVQALAEWDAEYMEELSAIDSLGTAGISDWQFGATLINDDDFTEYAQDLAEDIGAINKDAGWPTGYIDWSAAADALKSDYTAVEFLGNTFWVRT